MEETRAALQEQVKQQGEVVRKLKAEKADKDRVRSLTSHFPFIGASTADPYIASLSSPRL